MKKLLSILFLLLCLTSLSNAQSDNKGKFPAGIIYGGKGAHKIDAPKNWILDNKAGLPIGLHCLLQQKLI